MADRIIYIDTDVVGGLGDGSSWVNAYSSINAACVGVGAVNYTGEAGNVVFLSRASAGTPDNTRFDVSAHINMSSSKHPIWRGYGTYLGVLSTSGYTNTQAATNPSHLLCDYCEVDNIRIFVDHNSSAWAVFATGGHIGVLLNRVIAVSYRSGSPYWGKFLYEFFGDGTVTLRNCFIFGFIQGIDLSNGLGTTIINMENCTIAGCNYGTTGAVGVTRNFTNTYVHGFFIANGSGGAHTRTNSYASDSIGLAWNNPITYSISTGTKFKDITFPDIDLHIQSGSELIAKGLDMSGSYTIDIDGTTRTTWDVGGDEYATPLSGILKAIVGIPPTLMKLGTTLNWRRVRR